MQHQFAHYFGDFVPFDALSAAHRPAVEHLSIFKGRCIDCRREVGACGDSQIRTSPSRGHWQLSGPRTACQ